MTYRLFRASYFPEKRGEVEVRSMYRSDLANVLGLDADEVCCRGMNVAGRRLVIVSRQSMWDDDDEPPTAVSFDAYGVPIAEIRGDCLVLRKRVDNLVRYSASSVESLTDEDVVFLRKNFVQVPNTFNREMLALKLEWIA